MEGDFLFLFSHPMTHLLETNVVPGGSPTQVETPLTPANVEALRRNVTHSVVLLCKYNPPQIAGLPNLANAEQFAAHIATLSMENLLLVKKNLRGLYEEAPQS